MSLSPLTQGERAVLFLITWTDDDGNAVNLGDDSSFDMVWHPTTGWGGTRFIGTGQWIVISTTAGTTYYAPSAADMNNAGSWQLQGTIHYGSSGPVRFSDAVTLEIRHAL